MTSSADAGPKFQEAPPKSSEWKRITRVFLRRKVAVIGLAIILFLIVLAIFAPLIAPYDPYETDTTSQLASPNWEHWLGTDAIGRDTLSRIIYASRTSLLVGIGAVSMSAIIGQTLGLIAGYYGGWAFNIIMRLIDAMMSVPQLILALLISTLLGGGLKNVIIALGIGGIPIHCRMMCGQVLSVKENDYVLAGKTVGVSDLRMMFRHIFPNCLSPLIVQLVFVFAYAIVAEAALSFIGVGTPPPTPSLGNILSEGRNYLAVAPWATIAPGVAISVTVLALNLAGDGLRDILDPKMKLG